MDPNWYKKHGGHGFFPDESKPNDDGGKTGYTPIEMNFPGDAPDEATQKLHERLEKFQRYRLHGYTTRELANFDCLTTRQLQPASLENGIAPLFQRRNWQKQLDPGDFQQKLHEVEQYPGHTWIASDPLVWGAMKPVLVLASRMLLSVDALDWFDALVEGTRLPISDDRIAEAYKNEWGRPNVLKSFHRRDAAEFQQSSSARDNILHMMEHDYHFQLGFFYPNVEPVASTQKMACGDGFTTSSITTKRIRIFLNLAGYQLLLQSYLNPSERMSTEWYLAQTILHECMHAFGHALKFSVYDLFSGEPYFENEPFRECGWSYEMATTGGITSLHTPRAMSVPLAIFHYTPWLSKHTRFNSPSSFKEPILVTPPLAEDVTYWPMPMSLVEDMQQEDFWKVQISRYGHKMLRVKYLENGLKQNISGQITRVYKHPFLEERREIIQQARALGDMGIAMTPAERQACKVSMDFFADAEEQINLRKGITDQTALVKVIQDLKNSQATFQEESDTDQKVNEKLIAAVSAHSKTVKALIATEKHSGMIDRSRFGRRRELLLWNLRTRRFTKILMLASSHPNPVLEQMIIELHDIQMDLWPYFDQGEFWDEDEEIAEMTGERINDFKQLRAERIAAHALCSEFAKAVTELLIMSCQPNCYPPDHIEHRININRDILVRIDAEGLQKERDLEDWIAFANSVRPIVPPPTSQA